MLLYKLTLTLPKPRPPRILSSPSLTSQLQKLQHPHRPLPLPNLKSPDNNIDTIGRHARRLQLDGVASAEEDEALFLVGLLDEGE